MSFLYHVSIVAEGTSDAWVKFRASPAFHKALAEAIAERHGVRPDAAPVLFHTCELYDQGFGWAHFYDTTNSENTKMDAVARFLTDLNATITGTAAVVQPQVVVEDASPDEVWFIGDGAQYVMEVEDQDGSIQEVPLDPSRPESRLLVAMSSSKTFAPTPYSKRYSITEVKAYKERKQQARIDRENIERVRLRKLATSKRLEDEARIAEVRARKNREYQASISGSSLGSKLFSALHAPH